MNKKQIEKWGYEADNHADVVIAMPGEYHPDWHIVRDEYFASLVAAHEMEQCALVCDAMGNPWRGSEDCSAAIRQRNNQQSK